MYNELHEIWEHELQDRDLGKLPPDFYSKMADYLRRLREESRMLDKRTLKATLLRKEVRNAKRMIREVFEARYKKLLRKAAQGDKVAREVLTPEEEQLLTGVSPLAEAYQDFAKNLLQGHVSKMKVGQERRSVPLRFLKEVPAIIGADMKSYGPYEIEDVASLPVENARILVKQGLAERIEGN